MTLYHIIDATIFCLFLFFYSSSALCSPRVQVDDLFLETDRMKISHSVSEDVNNKCTKKVGFSLLKRSIRTFFCLSKLEPTAASKMILSNFFPKLPGELITQISEFSEPSAVVNLSLTCHEAYRIFSESFWKIRCVSEQYKAWASSLSSQKVFFGNFWYKSQQLSKIRKAASLGHPASKEKVARLLWDKDESSDDIYSIDYQSYKLYGYTPYSF